MKILASFLTNYVQFFFHILVYDSQRMKNFDAFMLPLTLKFVSGYTTGAPIVVSHFIQHQCYHLSHEPAQGYSAERVPSYKSHLRIHERRYDLLDQ